MNENHYVAHREKLMKGFDQASRWVMPALTRQYGAAVSQTLVRDARAEFESLLPGIPYIGGSKNRWTSELVESAQILALFHAMQRHGKTVDEAGEIIMHGMEARLASYPRWLLRVMGRLQFSRFFLNRLEREAQESQKREYPGNFVAQVVYPSGGDDFDWGIDFTECAIVRYYNAQGAAEYMPYLCRLDRLTSEAFGLGMMRTSTLAEGGDRCNPRLKRA